MAMQLTPPTKNIFHLSVFLALIGLILYFLGAFDVFEAGFQAVGHYAFWAALLGWLVLLIGVSAKGV
ncbi:MAG: hypothetical protein ACRECF_03135 [Methyloceanibacter sp.]